MYTLVSRDTVNKYTIQYNNLLGKYLEKACYLEHYQQLSFRYFLK